MNGRPIVGVTCYVEPARWGPWEARAALLPYRYVEMVAAGGGRAVVLPPDPDPDVLARLDALVVAGGADVGAQHYGAPPHPRTVDRPDRDAGELALVAAALDADLPLLGVCRGAQLLAVACGGSLHQHLPDLLGTERHQPAPGVLGEHPVRFAPGSRVAAFMGEAAEVSTYHHQAVADPGKLVVTGWADDGVVEAVEHPAATFAVGVQWHPEESGDARPFAALVGAARHRG